MCEDVKARKAMGELESRMSVQEVKVEMIEKYIESMSKDIKWIRNSMFTITGNVGSTSGKLDTFIKYGTQGGMMGLVVTVIMWISDRMGIL